MKKFSYLWISIIIILLDQLSKFAVRSNIAFNEIIEITPKLFWLTHVQNTGAAFSFSFGNANINRIVFIIITIIAIVLILYLKFNTSNKIDHIIFSMILGGAVGNLIDRILFGSVTDFIWCDFPDFIMHRWPVFNLADSSIVIAMILLFISTIILKDETKETK